MCGLLLDQIQKWKTTRWSLGAREPGDEKGDYEVYLHRYGSGDVKTFDRSFDPHEDQSRYASQQDFGNVVRSPHPLFPNRLVLLMAGPRALNTSAACVAATNPERIREVRRLLSKKGVDHDDKTTPFWVFLSGETDASGMLDWSGVRVIEVWTLLRRRPSRVPYLDQISRAIADSDVFLLVVSEKTIGSQQVDREVVSAFESAIPIVPLLVCIKDKRFRRLAPRWAHTRGDRTSSTLSRSPTDDEIERVARGLAAMKTPSPPLPLEPPGAGTRAVVRHKTRILRYSI